MPSAHLRPYARLARRDKVFGDGPAIPRDRNAKVRVMTYAKGWTATHRLPGQHKGPITRAYLEVLEALLWKFHNARSGRCFPSYERIADKARCNRDTVRKAIKVLEFARVLTWSHRLKRIPAAGRDKLGNPEIVSRVVRTSNAYVFLDPGISKAENPSGYTSQGFYNLKPESEGRLPPVDMAGSELEAALAKLQASISSREAEECHEKKPA